MRVGVKNRMANMLLFKTKLAFALTCMSMWLHCASVTLYIASEVTTVPQTSLTQMVKQLPDLAFFLIEFYGTGKVWSMLQLVSCIYSIKPTWQGLSFGCICINSSNCNGLKVVKRRSNRICILPHSNFIKPSFRVWFNTISHTTWQNWNIDQN